MHRSLCHPEAAFWPKDPGSIQEEVERSELRRSFVPIKGTGTPDDRSSEAPHKPRLLCIHRSLCHPEAAFWPKDPGSTQEEMERSELPGSFAPMENIGHSG